MSKGTMLDVLQKQAVQSELKALSSSLEKMEARMDSLSAQLEEVAQRIKGHQLWKVASEKIEKGANLTTEEAASYVCVSPKTLRRMEADKEIRRCPGLRGVVRFAARDVARLASARRKER